MILHARIDVGVLTAVVQVLTAMEPSYHSIMHVGRTVDPPVAIGFLGFFTRPTLKQHITWAWKPTRIFDLVRPHPRESSDFVPVGPC